MMRGYVLIGVLLLLLLTISGSGQGLPPAKLRWGSGTSAPVGSELVRIIGGGDWGAYTLRLEMNRRGRGRTFYLEAYDADLNLRRRVELPDAELRTEAVHLVKNDLFVLGTRRVSAEREELVVQSYGPDLQPAESARVLADIAVADRFRRRQFDLEFSRDSSHVLIYNQLPGERGAAEEFFLRTFDSRFRPLWSRSVILPYTDADFKVEDYTIDLYGRVYLLGRLGGGRDDDRRRISKPRYILMTFTEVGQQEYQLELPDQLLIDLEFDVNDRGEVICVGLYSEESTYTARGVYFLRLNPVTHETQVLQTTPFDISFMGRAHLENPLVSNRRSPELYRYRIRDLVQRSDGGAVLIAEQYWEQQTRSMPMPNLPVSMSTAYHYLDILVVNIRPDGSIEWEARLPKRQESMDDGGYYASFARATVRDRLYFVYNVHPRTFTEGDWYRYNLNSRNSVLALAEIDKDGAVRTFPLAFHEVAGVVTRPRASRQVGARRMLLVGDGGRQDKLGEVVFE